MSRRPPPATPEANAWLPADYDQYDVAAIQALASGTANDQQQLRALRWIVERACGTFDQPWFPGGLEGARATDFASGRRAVGLQIVKLTKLDASKLPRPKGD